MIVSCQVRSGICFFEIEFWTRRIQLNSSSYWAGLFCAISRHLTNTEECIVPQLALLQVGSKYLLVQLLVCNCSGAILLASLHLIEMRLRNTLKWFIDIFRKLGLSTSCACLNSSSMYVREALRYGVILIVDIVATSSQEAGDELGKLRFNIRRPNFLVNFCFSIASIYVVTSIMKCQIKDQNYILFWKSLILVHFQTYDFI